MKTSSKVFLCIIITVCAAGAYFLLNNNGLFSEKFSQEIQSIKKLAPIIGSKSPSQSLLTRTGIFTFTNYARVENSELGYFLPDVSLDEIALARVNDMFEKQYFEHVSPTGESASDVANDVGYSYISIGENIALGNFDGDEDIVNAWMESPGHRANILGTQFTHIGIAAKKGMYQGDEIWIAAQIFGRPLSDCPQPNEALKAKIENNQVLIEQMKAQAEKLYEELRSANQNQYNQKAAQYNALVEQINSKIAETKALVSQYNEGVKSFNNCIK